MKEIDPIEILDRIGERDGRHPDRPPPVRVSYRLETAVVSAVARNIISPGHGLTVPLVRRVMAFGGSHDKEQVSGLVGHGRVNELRFSRREAVVREVQSHPIEMDWIGFDCHGAKRQLMLMMPLQRTKRPHHPLAISGTDFDHRIAL